MNESAYLFRLKSIDLLFQLLTQVRGIGGALMIGQVHEDSSCRSVTQIYNRGALAEGPAGNAVVSVVGMKFGELLRHPASEIATPCIELTDDNNLWVTGYPGGIKARIGNTTYIAAFSGAPGPHDVLLSALALTILSCGAVTINHHGVMLHNQEEYDKAIKSWESRGRNVVRADIPDGSNAHQRAYTGFYLNGIWGCMEEVQLWPDPMRFNRAEHLDIAPVHGTARTFYVRLAHITSIASQKVAVTNDWWGGNGPGPRGEVATYDPKRDFEFAIHVRGSRDAMWTPDGLTWGNIT